MFLTYRVLRPDGAVVAQSDVSDSGSDTALTVTAYKLQGAGAVADEAVYSATVAGGSSAIYNVVMPALQTDGWWGGVDSTGYNFFYKLPVTTKFPGGQRYRVEFTLTLTSSASSTHGTVTMGNVRWASIIYVKPMVS